MDLNVDVDLLSIYVRFLKSQGESVKEDLYNRYRRNQKELDKVLKYLADNDVKIDDVNIQEILMKFLLFKVELNEKEIEIVEANSDILAKKFLKLKYETLHAIKTNVSELDEKRKRDKLDNLEKKYLNKEQVCQVYAIEARTLDELTRNGKIKTTQIKENGKHYYSVDFLDKFMLEFSNQ